MKQKVDIAWAEEAMEYKYRCEQTEVELAALLGCDLDVFTLANTIPYGIKKCLDILRGKM